MLATWRKPVRFRIDPKSNVFALVMVVLAFIALVTGMTVPQPHHGVYANLPVVNRPVSLPHALRYDAMVITIWRDGGIYFHNDRLPPERLADLIRGDMARGSERKVYIRADGR